MARLRGVLVARKVRALLSAPGATATAATAGLAVGIVIGLACALLIVPAVLAAVHHPED